MTQEEKKTSARNEAMKHLEAGINFITAKHRLNQLAGVAQSALEGGDRTNMLDAQAALEDAFQNVLTCTEAFRKSMMTLLGDAIAQKTGGDRASA